MLTREQSAAQASLEVLRELILKIDDEALRDSLRRQMDALSHLVDSNVQFDPQLYLQAEVSRALGI